LAKNGPKWSFFGHLGVQFFAVAKKFREPQLFAMLYFSGLHKFTIFAVRKISVKFCSAKRGRSRLVWSNADLAKFLKEILLDQTFSFH